MFYHLFTTIQKIAPSTSTSTSTRWRVQVPRYQVQVQVQVLNLQVQVRVQVPGICTRVQLEYKYKYQVLHLWSILIKSFMKCCGMDRPDPGTTAFDFVMEGSCRSKGQNRFFLRTTTQLSQRIATKIKMQLIHFSKYLWI